MKPDVKVCPDRIVLKVSMAKFICLFRFLEMAMTHTKFGRESFGFVSKPDVVSRYCV